MSRGRLVALAVVSEGALVFVAWAVSYVFGVTVEWGDPVRGVAIGAVAAVLLAVINHAILTRATSSWIVDGVRAVYHEVLVPVFGTLDTAGIVVIGIAAGLGEEWLFRGVLQPLLGWPAASVLFGLAHMGGRSMFAFAVWATAMGAALGGVAIVSGGLIAPIVAHGLYDMLALAYVRRSANEQRGMRQ
jgi:uncharacterized protein